MCTIGCHSHHSSMYSDCLCIWPCRWLALCWYFCNCNLAGGARVCDVNNLLQNVVSHCSAFISFFSRPTEITFQRNAVCQLSSSDSHLLFCCVHSLVHLKKTISATFLLSTVSEMANCNILFFGEQII